MFLNIQNVISIIHKFQGTSFCAYDKIGGSYASQKKYLIGWNGFTPSCCFHWSAWKWDDIHRDKKI